MRSVTTQQPAVEPIGLDDLVKLNVRVDTSDEDTLFNVWIPAARKFCENRISQKFITQKVDFYLDRWDKPRAGVGWFYLTGSTIYSHQGHQHDVIQIPYGPVQTVDSIEYFDTSDSVEMTIWDPTQYVVSLDRIQPVSNFPQIRQRIGAIKISVTVGYGDTAADVPDSAKHAMLLYVAEAYRQRAASSDLPLLKVPIGIDEALAPISTGRQYVI